MAAYLQSYRYFASSGLPFELRAMPEARRWVEERGIQLGIHVRRTDQLAAERGGNDPGARYFQAALVLLRRAVSGQALAAVVCTDDVEWVRQQAVFDGMHIRDGTASPVEDMAILASCKHMVMSLGTFGWWAAYLRMFAGETYYYATPFQRPMDYSEHFPPHWTGLADADVDFVLLDAPATKETTAEH